MNVIRWEPFGGMDEMFSRFPTMFERWARLAGSGEKGVEWSPSADISETDQEYLIRASLPAVKKEDVTVTVEDGMLTVSGQRRPPAAAPGPDGTPVPRGPRALGRPHAAPAPPAPVRPRRTSGR